MRPRVLIADDHSLICGFAYPFYPNFGAILSANSYEMPALTLELLLCLWLLLRGLRSPEKPLTSGQG